MRFIVTDCLTPLTTVCEIMKIKINKNKWILTESYLLLTSIVMLFLACVPMQNIPDAQAPPVFQKKESAPLSQFERPQTLAQNQPMTSGLSRPDTEFLKKFSSFQSNAIACDLPVKGMIFDASAFEDDTFQLTLDTVTLLDAKDVQPVKTSVYLCKENMEFKIKELKQQISQRIEQKSKLDGSRSIKALINENKTLKDAKIKIRNNFQKNIENYEMKGLFAVIVESKEPFTKEDLLIDAGRHYMGVEAVKTFLGEIIQSRTLLNNDIINSRISAQSFGVFNIDKPVTEWSSQIYNKKAQYVYAAVIKVAPLKQTGRTNDALPADIENCGVVNYCQTTGSPPLNMP